MLLKGAYLVPHPPLIIPEVGGGEERKIQATIDAMGAVASTIKSSNPDALIVVSPHAPLAPGVFRLAAGERATGSFADFRAPSVRLSLPVDRALTDAIASQAAAEGLATSPAPTGEPLDHGTLIPLWFLQQEGFLPPLVSLSISTGSEDAHRLLGRCIRRAARAEHRSFAFIASGDLSHTLSAQGPYGFTEEGRAFDELVAGAVEKNKLEGLFGLEPSFLQKAAECGLRPLQVLAGLLEGEETEARLLSYEAPFGVGYMVASFTPLAAAGDNPFTSLARRALEHYVKTGAPLTLPKELPVQFQGRTGGAFVTLYAKGQLRGCVGTIQATRGSLAEEIAVNAVSAGLKDPRFPPVAEEELEDLTYSVDILGPPRPVESMEELDPERLGLIVTRGWKKGLLLPDLPGVDTAEKQLAITLQKAGISATETYEMEVFDVERQG